MGIIDLEGEIQTIVNEDIIELLDAAVRRAGRWIERQHSFQYMRGSRYCRFGNITNSLTVVWEIFGSAGDVQLQNPALDGSITVGSISTPYYTELAVGDYVQFGPVVSAGYAPLAGQYGQVTAVTVSLGGTVKIAMSDVGCTNASQTQPTTFSLKKLGGNPFQDQEPRDPGLLNLGSDLKRIVGPILICDDQDKRLVLRKVKRLMVEDTLPQDESWNQSQSGSVPGGYRQLGQARNLPSSILGTDANVLPQDHILQFRPVPDKLYWTLVDAYRYTALPTSNSDSHWLLDEAPGLLIARAIFELGPGVKDPQLTADYEKRIPGELASAISADIEMEESDADDSMRYNPDSSSDL